MFCLFSSLLSTNFHTPDLHNLSWKSDSCVGVTFADLRVVKYSVAVFEQQEAGQTVFRPSINSEDFVPYTQCVY